jgi:inward rectifier potassium channel
LVRRPRLVSVQSPGVRAVKLGPPGLDLSDPYYLLLQMRWSSFVGAAVLGYLGVNLAFATLYWLSPGSVLHARPENFADAFFFSTETLATVGYGAMSPGSFFGHVVATAEMLVGLFITALLTGGFFARFARPHARLLFSDTAVIAPYEGGRALMIRVASRRAHSISEAAARISALPSTRTADIHAFRRFAELRLVRRELPMLSLSWTLIHPIDEASPLWSIATDDLADSGLVLIASVSGFDEAISAIVTGRKAYMAGDLRAGHAFVDITTDLPDGRLQLDLTRFHETAPVGDG